MTYKDKFIYVFSSLIPVIGAKRSILIDTQKKDYHFIPNELAKIIIKEKHKLNTSHILSRYANIKGSKAILEGYFRYLLENKFATFIEPDEVNRFPVLSLKYNSPHLISNVLIDYSDIIYNRLNKIAFQTNLLNVQAVHFRFFTIVDFQDLIHLAKSFANHSSSTIILDLQYNVEVVKRISEVIRINQRITNVTFYNSPEQSIKRDNEFNTGIIILTKQKLLNSRSCGIVRPYYFSKEIDHISESKKHNTCLNGKIAIDAEGNIKNCPSLNECFGNISKISLENVIEKKQFKKYWNIKKDDIAVCRDCEFRHICTDCRAYIENPKDIKSKPLKCGYNPYSGEWKEWSLNPLKKEIIKYYKMEDI